MSFDKFALLLHSGLVAVVGIIGSLLCIYGIWINLLKKEWKMVLIYSSVLLFLLFCLFCEYKYIQNE
jgi:hypothetical protein